MSESPIEQVRRASKPEDAVVVGRVTGSWGIRGDLKVESLTDVPQRFSSGARLYLDGRPVTVERARKYRGGLLVKLDLVSDRSHAESLRGSFLTIYLADVEPVPEGSYYHFQIIDMGVWTEEGEYLGEVKEILVTGSNDVYVVKDISSKKEVSVPALKSVVLKVDLQENRMVVRLPEGLR